MIDVIFTGLPLAMLIATAYWYRGSRRAGTPGAWIMVVLTTSFAVALGSYSTLTHSVQEAIAPHFAHLVNNSATLVAAVSSMGFLLTLNVENDHKRRRMMRPRVIALGLVLLAMFVTFFATTPDARFAPDHNGHHVEPLAMVIYAITYGLYLTAALADSLRQMWINSKDNPRRATRIGLRITGTGFAFALSYSLYKVYDAIGTFTQVGGSQHNERCTSAISPIGCAMGVTVPALAILLVIIGLTMPVVAWTIQQVLRRRWEKRALAALEPLWLSVTSASPAVVLPPDEVTPESQASDYLLHRRVIEIFDGVIASRHHRSLRVQQLAAAALTDWAGDPADSPEVEAAVLADALDGMREGRDFQLEHAPLPPSAAASEGNLREETEWLLSVAAALTTSPRWSAPPPVSA
ncbi:hypothetical protein ABH940_005439 [Streptacidiphilus sp. BW17]|uniref:MAB_1171c family putative transporter n=1 Tax=Streptacidiphilus sp. BW17 TaxID=3156274 RepID=UPI00351619D5